GWRIGYVAAPAFLTKAMNRLQSHATSNPCSISQKAALAALTSPQTCVTEMVGTFEKRRNYILERLTHIPGLKTMKPSGAFYVFPNISAYHLSSSELCARLLDEAYVAVIPGAPFGRDDYIRISYSASMESLVKGMDAMEKFFQKL
ncbi:MAG: aminotransferase class I/II-fold pyridoxal phosphate-dependent enzyme, partial [Chlamydiota bacterium]|nr:aminotransferase class I/II-fold pyridoxal phosphate-dependent enzyme [Chlamydiota bacterium]